MGLFDRKNTTVANTTSQMYDQRSVNDAGGGIVGEGNFQDQSINLTSFNTTVDGGAFSVIGSVADGVADTSRLQTSAAEKIALAGIGAGNKAMEAAIDSQRQAFGFSDDIASRSFDLSRSTAAQAFESSSDALGFARSTFGDVVDLARSVVGQAGDQAKVVAGAANSAYASASDTSSGNKTLLYAGIAAVALIGVVVAFNAFRG